MTDFLLMLTDAFADNYIEFKSAFFEDNSFFPRICSYIITSRKSSADRAKLEASKKIVKTSDHLFDGISEYALPVLSTYISLSEAPEEKTINILSAYKAFKEYFIPSPFIILAACIVEDTVSDKTDFYDIAKRTKLLYERMQENHPFLTGYDDLSVCALYAVSEKDDEDAIREMEKCAEILKEKTVFKNSTQALTHVLTFYNHPEEACRRIIKITEELRKLKINMGSSFTAVSLGALAVSDEDPFVLAQRVQETYNILKKKNGFSFLSVSRNERLMYSAFLTALDSMMNNSQNPVSHIMAHKIAVYSALSANITDTLEGISLKA